MFKKYESKAKEYKSQKAGASWPAKSKPELITSSLQLFAKDGTQLTFVQIPVDKDLLCARKFGQYTKETEEIKAYKVKLPTYEIFVANEVVAAFNADDAEQMSELKAQGELA